MVNDDVRQAGQKGRLLLQRIAKSDDFTAQFRNSFHEFGAIRVADGDARRWNRSNFLRNVIRGTISQCQNGNEGDAAEPDAKIHIGNGNKW
jgi:hypothetical protein